MSKPLHPATVHFPITAALATAALDVVYFLSQYGPTATIVASTFKSLDIALSPSLFPVLSYYTTILTLLFSIPAVLTGIPQMLPLIQRDGFKTKKAQIAVAHAAINYLTIGGAAYNWWTRRENTGFLPSEMNILVSSVLAMPATVFAAGLGGSLVYVYGMGMGGGGGAARAKKAQ
ncbi:hypothetical protein L13192_00753 [Pyrenophora tritici-repentis]|uniref:Uncharacterized protein n=2 Tax=Pyrenophora tritici-repentis TaxID=45151 RepID=A0A317A1K4_9PLEO|nr:uncharacterized protein PTRG_01727 [Pyrenophora tritici-repentis Pt-1C-BFP]EDU41165.1 conserved hypothetical protein [Pyrenophora tritici-repentis Pt-1C-BFP]KAI1518279.1 hypothetical protein Ptr86124_003580 [Pyrenophora tritici-repentis]KAI1674006.1 hypothetical protein L13192_00753 [Pyrenophora tritici-repentis]KAI1688902.1 hypothetical protein KJE20_02080 [Pyrenophora tritici-repentis]